jgi:hypothetical protein
VQYYDFEVLKGDDIISAERRVALDDSRAAWPKILGIAKTLKLPGCRIRVREQQGDTIILIGASAACRYPAPAAYGLVV